MTKRKTVDVTFVKEQVNMILSKMEGDNPGDARYRKGMMTLLENILFETGNYKGFQYLDAAGVPDNCKPGMNSGFIGDHEATFFNTDDTRVCYL